MAAIISSPGTDSYQQHGFVMTAQSCFNETVTTGNGFSGAQQALSRNSQSGNLCDFRVPAAALRELRTPYISFASAKTGKGTAEFLNIRRVVELRLSKNSQ